MKQFVELIRQFWCINMHSGVMWPYRGHYQCRVCLREYPVPFEAAAAPPGMAIRRA